MLRLGLCCLFRQAQIKFRSTTAKSLLRLERSEHLARLDQLCLESWQRVGREPYLHISSPKHGWEGNPKPHADFIDRADFPDEWLGLSATLDVETKAKEPAVLRLKEELSLPDWPGEGASHG